MKAGRLSSGEVACEAAIKSKKAKLIIIALDASENTKKSFKNSAQFYNIELIEYGNKSELGYALGKEQRSVIAINDDGFASRLKELTSN
jgi:ribosomal protein L7Ae-like RNA K-turn-binding protein